MAPQSRIVESCQQRQWIAQLFDKPIARSELLYRVTKGELKCMDEICAEGTALLIIMLSLEGQVFGVYSPRPFRFEPCLAAPDESFLFNLTRQTKIPLKTHRFGRKCEFESPRESCEIVLESIEDMGILNYRIRDSNGQCQGILEMDYQQQDTAVRQYEVYSV